MGQRGVNVDQLDAATRKRLGLKRSRRTEFNKEDVRRGAIRVLAEIADLTQDQRRRVLRHALTVNES